MALEHRLEFRMLQKLILTPQLQQAIKLLQMPQIELSQMLTNELVENPLLEEIVDESDSDEQGVEKPHVASDDAEIPLERLVGFSVDDYFDTRSYDGRDLGYFSPDVTPSQTLEQFVCQDNTLYDHLLWQLRLLSVPVTVRNVAEVVIGNIDDNGYLQATVQEIAEYFDSNIEIAMEAIRLVQGLDPRGVGAQDIKECLILQLDALDLRGTLVEDLIRNNLHDIERRRYQNLAQSYGRSLDEIKKAVKVIEGLEPKPGSGMSGTQPIYIKPDVFVIWDDEDFRIILNDESIPNVRINSFYRKLLSNKHSLKKEEKEYLEERLRSAVWLLKSLDHRNKTIYRVTESILNFQRNFFLQGVSQMRPLNLKTVAAELDMHESTISRATSNKYLSCSHGLFNFRFFFSSSVNSSTGSVSSTSVKDLIKKIVSGEDPAKPLSDRKIADTLKNFSIKVARRTVAKYRDELKIPSQSLRKSIDST
jgi:RNA polymerase sigma-54 factor